MRPIRLSLEGFTAFRERCEIDFSPFGLFAITGQTGAGKTSLLDAMTYALYGKTPRLNKAGKDLVSQGANSMSVLLHFRVGAEEYQVARAIRGATVTARLERRENGEWKALSGTLTDVNDRVQNAVGLDFSGFTKTVLLPQGKFDGFLRGEPKERREVLSELLDLNVYQQMMKSANEKSKHAGIRLEERIANIDSEATLEAKTEREQQLEQFLERERAAVQHCDKLRKSLTEALTLREKRGMLAASQRELEKTRISLMETNTNVHKAKEQLENQGTVIGTLDQQIESASYDADLHLRLNGVLPQARRQRKLIDQLTGEQKKREAKGSDLEVAKKTTQTARGELDAAASRLNEAERHREDAADAFNNLRGTHGSADAIQQVITDLEIARKEAADSPAVSEQIREWETRAITLKVEIDAGRARIEEAESNLKERERLYEHSHARDRGAALRHELRAGEACPVCEQTVDKVPAVPSARGLDKAREQVAQAKAALQSRQEELLKVRAEALELPAKRELALRQLEMRKSRIEQTTLRAQSMLGERFEDPIPALLRVIELTKQAERKTQQAQLRYESAQKQQGEAATLLQKIEHKKEMTEADLSNLSRQIKSFEQELAALEEVLRDTPPVEEITRQLSALEAAKKKRAGLEAQRKIHEAAWKRATDALTECEKRAAMLGYERSKCEEAVQSLQKEVANREKQLKKSLGDTALSAIPDEAAQIERMEASSREDLTEFQREVQKCRYEIDDLARRIDRNEKLREEAGQLKAQSALYRDLGTWLNAGNFQQYLLGSAFEILAKEGSKHLKELSSERYEFAFEGDEFVVSDRLNGGETRSVRTLSGGESFLASLALALALAESITQLNGERGAVNLESLFLDEGFSTLDYETLGKVSDALEVLQSGKRLIGIVTHVQALADQMPMQIEVEKTASGSRIAQARLNLTARL